MHRVARRVGLSCVALLAVVAVSGCHSGGKSKTKTPTADELVTAGLTALKQGNTQAATSAFVAAEKADPRNYYAPYNLGTIYQRAGNTTLALQEYGQALQINPTYVPALYNSATIYGSTNPQLAIVTLRQVIKLQPKAPTAYLNLGLLEAKLGIFPQATDDLSTALKQDGSLSSSIPKDVLKNSPTPHPAASK